MDDASFFDFILKSAIFAFCNLNIQIIIMVKKVKHIVMFKLSGDAAERREVALRFREALLELPGVIDCLISMEVGINENPAETWDVVLTAEVPDMASVETYAKHPAHLAAAAILDGHKEARACVDYEF